MVVVEAPTSQVDCLPCAVQQLDPLKGCVYALLWRVILDLVDYNIAFV
jgi:hypothetical protein